MTHTPGPWTHDDIYGLILHGRTEIAALHSGNKANANLIAAAPDLLAALESFVNFGRTVSTESEAKIAISKAKGE